MIPELTGQRCTACGHDQDDHKERSGCLETIAPAPHDYVCACAAFTADPGAKKIANTKRKAPAEREKPNYYGR